MAAEEWIPKAVEAALARKSHLPEPLPARPLHGAKVFFDGFSKEKTL